MSWLVFALLSPAVFTVVNFVDKYIVEHEVRDTRAMPIYASVMALIAGCVLWVLTGFPLLSLHDTLLILLTGAISNWASALYFKALTYEDTSKIIVLMQMQPVMVLILSAIFLGEIITGEQLLGFALILGAAIGTSLTGTKKIGRRADFPGLCAAAHCESDVGVVAGII
ncbi:MAG TPA: EamA family transporter [Phototrophicaceae bacterium]|nr:EamA family transporter [Phototrophicaceae bacterium]